MQCTHTHTHLRLGSCASHAIYRWISNELKSASTNAPPGQRIGTKSPVRPNLSPGNAINAGFLPFPLRSPLRRGQNTTNDILMVGNHFLCIIDMECVHFSVPCFLVRLFCSYLVYGEISAFCMVLYIGLAFKPCRVQTRGDEMSAAEKMAQ